MGGRGPRAKGGGGGGGPSKRHLGLDPHLGALESVERVCAPHDRGYLTWTLLHHDNLAFISKHTAHIDSLLSASSILIMSLFFFLNSGLGTEVLVLPRLRISH